MVTRASNRSTFNFEPYSVLVYRIVRKTFIFNRRKNEKKCTDELQNNVSTKTVLTREKDELKTKSLLRYVYDRNYQQTGIWSRHNQ